MAVVVLAGALAFAQAAYLKARTAADLALEIRTGRDLLDYVLIQPLAETGTSGGENQAFRWRVSLAETGRPGRVVICRRAVRIESLDRASRAFEISRLEPCPPKAAS